MLRITNLGEFDTALKEFAKLTELSVAKVAKKTAFLVFKGVIQRTPVDTGWARASWNFTEGTADDSVAAKPTKGAVAPAPAPPHLIDNPFPIYYITNNLKYIIPLENGHSKQMEKGYMVQRTMVAVHAELRNFKL